MFYLYNHIFFGEKFYSRMKPITEREVVGSSIITLMLWYIVNTLEKYLIFMCFKICKYLYLILFFSEIKSFIFLIIFDVLLFYSSECLRISIQ